MFIVLENDRLNHYPTSTRRCFQTRFQVVIDLADKKKSRAIQKKLNRQAVWPMRLSEI